MAWARRRQRGFASSSWTCGSRFAWRPRTTPRKPVSCSTSFTSCAIWATPSTIRKREYARVSGGSAPLDQKYTLLAHRAAPSAAGAPDAAGRQQAVRNTAYLLKESFGQQEPRPGGLGAPVLRALAGGTQVGKRLGPVREILLRRFGPPGGGIAAYSIAPPRNRVALGFVEGLNNKIACSSVARTGSAMNKYSGSRS